MPGMQQVQSLSMQQTLAPQLQQSLQILAAPALELRQMVTAELAVNPTLEELPTEPSLEDCQRERDRELDEEFGHLARLDEEWRELMAQGGGGPARSAEAQERRQFLLDSLTASETLQQHLLEQLADAGPPPRRRKLAELIIGNIDDNGFLQATPREMAENTGLSAGDGLENIVAELDAALAVVQTFDPAGVAARDLRECLLLQLRRQGREGGPEWRIVDRELEELARRRLPEIARRLGVTTEEVQRCADAIARLNPRPGRQFAPETTQYVQPDVSVARGEDGGGWQVALNEEQLPRLRISGVYKDLMAQEGSAAEVRDYIREKIRGGKFLIKSIHQRQQTIANIAREIVARQQAFFEEGPAALAPMTMEQVAKEVRVHETTVSRAIAGKYMGTPWGVFPLKYFFTSGYTTASGETTSNTSVKNALIELIKSEDARRPYSDQELVEILTGQGIPIARRTVAKYRTEAGLLPSHLRKSYG